MSCQALYSAVATNLCSRQPIIDVEKPWLPPHAFALNTSNPMESEMLPIYQVFRTVHVLRAVKAAT
jgi:hypothetical protein